MANFTGSIPTTTAPTGPLVRGGTPATVPWSVVNRVGTATGVVFGTTPPVVVTKTTGQLWPAS